MNDTTIARLLAASRTVSAAGISPGSTGNISIRDDTQIYISASGTRLGALEPHQVAVLTLAGEPVSEVKASKEAPLHVAFYQRNPTHRAVVHVHSPYAVAASCLEPWSEYSALPPVTPYFIMKVGQTPLLDYRAPGSRDLAELVGASRFAFHAALLANHGQITSGTDADAAIDAALELEEASRIRILTAGLSPRLLPPGEAAELARAWGTPWGGAVSGHSG